MAQQGFRASLFTILGFQLYAQSVGHAIDKIEVGRDLAGVQNGPFGEAGLSQFGDIFRCHGLRGSCKLARIDQQGLVNLVQFPVTICVKDDF